MVASFRNFLHYKELLFELVRRDFITKYRRSILGMLWSLLNPLGMMLILTAVFSHLFRGGIENFPVYLMCGTVIFNFFNEATSVSMGSVLGNASLIKKVYVPKYLFPMASIFSSFINLATSFVALIIVMIVTKTAVAWTILLFWVPIVYVFVFALGLGLFLSALVVSFRDMQHLYGILVTAWMYLTPIFYPITMLPPWLRPLVGGVNPLGVIIEMFRDFVLNGIMPDPMLHVKALLWCVAAMTLGLITFVKQQDSFILKI
ncbi:MAG: ABC transporter permease [Clostridiales Family XIII bacterium]|nr:ABC transporter permease [Clostridiales Family XIII bacterium]